MSHICGECGERASLNYVPSVAKQLVDNQVCFNCHFWYGCLKKATDPNTVRIEGMHYYIHNEPSPGEEKRWLGFGGREFKIRFFDGRIVTTHNLWCQGEIPERFKSRLPDNAMLLREDY